MVFRCKDRGWPRLSLEMDESSGTELTSLGGDPKPVMRDLACHNPRVTSYKCEGSHDVIHELPRHIRDVHATTQRHTNEMIPVKKYTAL